MSTLSWGNLKKQADDASRPLPKDWYDLEVVKADVKTASTGALMISARLKVVSGPYANRALFTNFVLSTENANALAIFFKNMAAFGLDDAFFESLTGADSDISVGLQTVANNLVGRSVRGEVGTRTYQGTERNEITQYARPQGQSGASGFNAPRPATGSGAPTIPGGAPSVPATTAVPSVPTPTPASAPAPTTDVSAPPAPPVF